MATRLNDKNKNSQLPVLGAVKNILFYCIAINNNSILPLSKQSFAPFLIGSFWCQLPTGCVYSVKVEIQQVMQNCIAKSILYYVYLKDTFYL